MGNSLLLISHSLHLGTAWAGIMRSLILPNPGGQRKEGIPHIVNFLLCKSRMEQECGGAFLQTLEKCDVFKAPSCLSDLTGSKAGRIKLNCWCWALNLLQHPQKACFQKHRILVIMRHRAEQRKVLRTVIGVLDVPWTSQSPLLVLWTAPGSCGEVSLSRNLAYDAVSNGESQWICREA